MTSTAAEIDTYLNAADGVIEGLSEKLGEVRQTDERVENLREQASKRFHKLCIALRKGLDDDKTRALAAKIADDRATVNSLAVAKLQSVKAAYKVGGRGPDAATRFCCCCALIC